MTTKNNTEKHDKGADSGREERLVRLFPFSFSEALGPFNCEISQCPNNTFIIWLTKDECESLEEKGGPKTARRILTQKMGTCLCSDHSPNAMDDTSAPNKI